MRRDFDFYDDDVITKELEAIPARDAAKLVALMDYYETVGDEDPSPAKIGDYGEGIKRIRHIKANYKGRGLFYVGETQSEIQKLWLLTVFKKEGNDVPGHILKRAKLRKAAHEASQRGKRGE